MFFDKETQKLLKHEVIKGVLIAFIGALLTLFVQISVLHQQQSFEIYKERLAVINEISIAANQRRWEGLGYIWSIKRKNSAADIQVKWNEYYKSVENWNRNLPAYAAKLRLFGCDSRLIRRLVDDSEGGDVIDGVKSPESLHGNFLITHERIRKLNICERNSCATEEKGNLILEAEQQTFDLGRSFYDFIELCSLKIKA